MRIRTPVVMASMTVLALIAQLISASPTAAGADVSRRPECTITGTNGDDEIHGTSGPDVICARGGDDRVDARGGDDIIYGGRGRDAVYAWSGDDGVYGGPGSDIIFGMRGDDRLFGQAGGDAMLDWLGRDLLSGGHGGDALHADDGHPNDRLLGGARRDTYCADAGDILRSLEKALDYTGCMPH